MSRGETGTAEVPCSYATRRGMPRLDLHLGCLFSFGLLELFGSGVFKYWYGLLYRSRDAVAWKEIPSPRSKPIQGRFDDGPQL